MRLLHMAALAAIVTLLPAASAAAGEHAIVSRSDPRLLGELYADLYSLPVSENPFFGNGNRCLRLARRVVEAVEGGPCTIPRGTADMIGLGSVWSNVEPPFPATAAAQRAVSLQADEDLFEKIDLKIDDSAPVEIRTRRYALFSAQRTVQLPVDNILGVPPQTVTLAGHGWFVMVRNLSLGTHTIVQDALLASGDHQTLAYTVNVIPAPRDR
jgi:hypothetical protein